MSLKRNFTLHDGESLHRNVQNHEKSHVRRRIAIQNEGLDLQADRPTTDDLQLWPSAVNSASEQLGGAYTSRNELITETEAAPVKEQICFGMLVHEKVKLVGKGEHLRGKIMALKQSNLNLLRQVFQIKPSAAGELFLIFPDGTEFGYMSEKAKRTFGQLIELSQLEFETWISLTSILDVLRLAETSAEAAIRVDVHVYGLETRQDQIGRQISRIRYDNPHILRFDDEKESDVEEEGNFAEEEAESNLSVEGDEDFQEIIATVSNL
ncbi:helicase [Penicillium malachiteum]|uniref:helicase n=1 Tax=Penicillium malachiteum TaxID=1324776 RepID=UPI002547B06D|nr:helicase [Penicillium malachiteum]KAJ5725809.1 helicase [Penicillium malachiteum]